MSESEVLPNPAETTPQHQGKERMPLPEQRGFVDGPSPEQSVRDGHIDLAEHIFHPEIHNTSEKLAVRELSPQEVVTEFLRSKRTYEEKRGTLFGQETHSSIPLSLAKIAKAAHNFFRMPGDLLRNLLTKGGDERLNDRSVRASVLRREGFVDSALFGQLYANPKNRNALKAFLENELFAEANCTHFIALEGLSIVVLHKLMDKLGHNPHAFLSDDRGENGGRIAMDNTLEGGKHPLLSPSDPRYGKEMEYWRPVFPTMPRWLPLSRWMQSRTHSVVYTVTDGKQELIILPVHVDPKNAVSVFGELLGKKGGRGALSYHRPVVASDKTYIGTGLYRLGCNVFLDQLKKAKAHGIIKDVLIDGRYDDIAGDTSIVGSEMLSRQTAEILGRTHLPESRV
ncbi:hypothetical protein HY411_02915 [Candidatus Gottesmanbacteria bacterium]|nr:hypothetical protein [Candidatus Gottesmanbacteria bacterium]